MENLVPPLSILGQVLFGLYWVYNGLNHFLKTRMLADYAKSKHVPAPMPAVLVAGLFIFLGGLSILSGLYVEYGLALIAVFLLVVSLFMHNFWVEKDPMTKMMQMVQFMKNFALLAACLMLMALGSDYWPWILPLE